MLSWREVSFRGPQVPIASATVSEGADRPERSAGKKTFDNRILILRRFKRRFGSESNPSAKVLLFSDMAMGCPGLRAVLVRIACNQPLVTPVTAVTSVTQRVFIF